ncbi:hypothetical protein RND71_033804 [Anisodus tanguticus]|uniref:Uncharacterized protein n=1 Tax=Anisodus tanguticus TaxID=243964 RepID=A0AAE1R8F8_9SOLA|nr:hypothetical protein RND71_033804 [Anisodus tanguticus]
MFYPITLALELALKRQNCLLIVAEDVDSEALATLILNKLHAEIYLVSFLLDMLDSKAEVKNKFEEMLSAAAKFKRISYIYVQVATGEQRDLEKHVDFGGYGYLATVALLSAYFVKCKVELWEFLHCLSSPKLFISLQKPVEQKRESRQLRKGLKDSKG